MGRLSFYARTRLVNLMERKPYLRIADLKRQLEAEDGVIVSRQSLSRFLKKYKETGLIQDLPRAGRNPILKLDHCDFIDTKMEVNNELSAIELRDLLRKEFDIQVSRRTVQRMRRKLGWKFQKTHYCQLISEKNRKERLEFCLRMLATDEKFENVIFSDETKIQMESSTLRSARKSTDKRYQRLRPKPKHPYSVLAWGAISLKGATNLCVFRGKMDALYYQEIIGNFLLPFIHEKFSHETHRFMQDNDPKHTARSTREFFEENGINWWKTPPESPDLNPIEMIWHYLKQAIRKHAKPKTKDELLTAIQQIWRTVTPSLCQRYIYHLQKVIPIVVLREGRASGY